MNSVHAPADRDRPEKRIHALLVQITARLIFHRGASLPGDCFSRGHRAQAMEAITSKPTLLCARGAGVVEDANVSGRKARDPLPGSRRACCSCASLHFLLSPSWCAIRGGFRRAAVSTSKSRHYDHLDIHDGGERWEGEEGGDRGGLT